MARRVDTDCLLSFCIIKKKQKMTTLSNDDKVANSQSYRNIDFQHTRHTDN